MGKTVLRKRKRRAISDGMDVGHNNTYPSLAS